TASGKVEIVTDELHKRLASAGHHALPEFYTHPEVTGSHPRIHLSTEMVVNPVNPHALTPVASIQQGNAADSEFPLMGIIGRPSVVHFAGVTHWTFTGKQMNGVRLIQLHPSVAEKLQIRNGEAV